MSYCKLTTLPEELPPNLNTLIASHNLIDDVPHHYESLLHIDFVGNPLKNFPQFVREDAQKVKRGLDHLQKIYLFFQFKQFLSSMRNSEHVSLNQVRLMLVGQEVLAQYRCSLCLLWILCIFVLLLCLLLTSLSRVWGKVHFSVFYKTRKLIRLSTKAQTAL